MWHYDAVAGSRQPGCQMPSVGCRLSVVGCQMRLSRRSDAILSRFVHQSFDVGTRTEITVLVCETGVFAYRDNSRCPGLHAIVLRENRGQYVDFGIGCIPPILFVGVCGLWGLSCPGSRKWPEIAYRDNDFCPGANVNRLTPVPGQIRARGTIGRGPVAGVERDVVMIAPALPHGRPGAIMPFGCSTRTSPA